jgi:Domain of unknown function (DUF4265)
MNDELISVHVQPAWRQHANYIIRAALPECGRVEQLWARKINERQFELCCIPFFLFDVALGDVVEADPANQMVRVIKPSGRFVFRAWFGESADQQLSIIEELESLGALVERASPNLIAVDAVDAPAAQNVANYLQTNENLQRVIYETGRT